MMSKTGVHAVRAMVALAQLPAGEFAGAARVAEQIDAPQSYLGKLLQTLARAGLVQSQRGLGGGFALSREPQQISVYDVVEPIESVARWSGCVLGHEGCSDAAPCAMHPAWKRVRQGYLDMLRRTTLADLVRQGEVALDLPGLLMAQKRINESSYPVSEAVP